MLVLPHFFSWAHVPQLFSQQPPKSQFTFLQFFGEELWNHFDVVFCHTRYMMSASFWQHHSCIYPNTLIPSNSSKYWRLLKITVDNIVIFTVKHYMFPKLIAINRDLTAQYFFFQCAMCVCVCVCVWSPDLSTRSISCHNTVSEPSHCDIEPQLSTDKDNWCHYALHLVHCSCIPA